MSSDYIEIYTDGACKKNPGAGGWGAILIYGDHIKEIYGGQMMTTNNRMELTAAIEGLKQVKKSILIKLYTDSKYLQQGMTMWLNQWQKSNWKNGTVKNKDLWLELASLDEKMDIQWIWVKAHNGNYYNERADELANSGVLKYAAE